MQKSILISKLESPTIVTPWKSTAYAYETSFPRINIFTILHSSKRYTVSHGLKA